MEVTKLIPKNKQQYFQLRKIILYHPKTSASKQLVITEHNRKRFVLNEDILITVKTGVPEEDGNVLLIS